MNVGVLETMCVCGARACEPTLLAYHACMKSILLVRDVSLPLDCGVCAEPAQGCRGVPATATAPWAAPVVQHARLAFIVPPVRASIGSTRAGARSRCDRLAMSYIGSQVVMQQNAQQLICRQTVCLWLRLGA